MVVLLRAGGDIQSGFETGGFRWGGWSRKCGMAEYSSTMSRCTTSSERPSVYLNHRISTRSFSRTNRHPSATYSLPLPHGQYSFPPSKQRRKIPNLHLNQPFAPLPPVPTSPLLITHKLQSALQKQNPKIDIQIQILQIQTMPRWLFFNVITTPPPPLSHQTKMSRPQRW